MDSDAIEIVKKHQQGLLLYKGGTVCQQPDVMAADAICREMNYTRAARSYWGNKFDIQNDYDTNLVSYQCIGPVWDSCSYVERKDQCRYYKNYNAFLTCTGMTVLIVKTTKPRSVEYIYVCAIDN